MSHSSDTVSDEIFELSFNVILRLALAALLIFWCFLILRPFLILIVWAVILAVAFGGVFEKLCRIVGGRRAVAPQFSPSSPSFSSFSPPIRSDSPC